MKQFMIPSAAALILAACSGNPISVYDEGGEAGDDTPIEVDDTCGTSTFLCSEDVDAVSYDSDTDVLRISGTPFDETAIPGTYVRANTINNAGVGGYGYDYPSGNLNGFNTYENDDDDAINPYLAIIETSADGSVTVGQVGVMAGYRDYGYSGYFVRVNDESTPPRTELTTYSGEYAGIVATQNSSDTYTSQGGVYFEVDFGDEYIKGRTVGRSINGGPAVADVIFDDTPIVGNAYSGNAVNFDAEGEPDWEGTYQGYFTGSGASTTGGVFVVSADEFGGDEDITGRETGVFIATED